MIIDTHIHLSHYLYNNEFPFLSLEEGEFSIQRGTREELIQQLRSSAISACIEPGIDLESNQRILSLAEQYSDFLFPAVGVHPTRTYQYKVVENGSSAVRRLHWNQRHLIEQYAEYPGVFAIGETGLDYHLPRKEQHRLCQMAWFIFQLRLAHRKKLPVILHIRKADKDALRILKLFRRCLHGGVCHCFVGSADLAREYTSLGIMLGIGGTLLMDTPLKNNLEQAVIHTPMESILLETDGPYVKPSCPELKKKQMKKARNTSLILPAVAMRIAELKQLPVEEVLKVSAENAVYLFNLPCKLP